MQLQKRTNAKIAELMKKDTAKYLVYSTYAIQYISKITTTYGDYLDGVIYLNTIYSCQDIHKLFYTNKENHTNQDLKM